MNFSANVKNFYGKCDEFKVIKRLLHTHSNKSIFVEFPTNRYFHSNGTVCTKKLSISLYSCSRDFNPVITNMLFFHTLPVLFVSTKKIKSNLQIDLYVKLRSTAPKFILLLLKKRRRPLGSFWCVTHQYFNWFKDIFLLWKSWISSIVALKLV